MISVATIADITRRGRGTSHAWRVEASPERVTDSWQTHHLYHYGTRMLSWRIARHAGSDYGYTELVDYSLGWGSVSDQNGDNTAFRVLDLPYRFDRDARGGGPRVTELRGTRAAITPTSPSRSAGARRGSVKPRRLSSWS